MNKQHVQASREKSKRQILDQLADIVSFDLPETLEKEEYNSICKAMNPSSKPETSSTKPTKHLNLNQIKVWRNLKKLCSAKRVRLGLVLSEIGRKNSIKVEEDDTRNAMMREIKIPRTRKENNGLF